MECKTANTPATKTASEADGYRALVEKAARESNGREVVLNRDVEHACVIVETLFRKATSLVEIITTRLVDATYGTPRTIDAAIAFLRFNDQARIEILVEGVIPDNNALLCALKKEGLLNRVTCTTVPKDLQTTYQDHIIVCDGVHYRYQKNRGDCKAMAQFGNYGVGSRLQQQFQQLKAKALAAA